MSDLGRKNVSDKVNEAVQPDSEKSALDKTKEQVTDKLDKVAAKGTPEDQKSFAQTISDNIQTGHDDAKKKIGDDESTLADTASQYVDAAKEQIGNAAQYVSGVVTGAKEGASEAA
ncbi:hypothetical protein HYPBUDRAFT_95311, partial [Hyphopichia burtonii NRRL Y-1933]